MSTIDIYKIAMLNGCPHPTDSSFVSLVTYRGQLIYQNCLGLYTLLPGDSKYKFIRHFTIGADCHEATEVLCFGSPAGDYEYKLLGKHKIGECPHCLYS